MRRDEINDARCKLRRAYELVVEILEQETESNNVFWRAHNHIIMYMNDVHDR